ncbi:long-chain-fatty-acid--CoA ligase [Acidithrix ferrooxidans]|uniref:Long-chain-fatty-acid--CoA ligase n=2 Tax=Acidithrix ferrooxidans TaxID=1280514 RepID=A0A0D8HM02_9ACTN|nr:long-chain-fatty-acid--CoA ligase [Acidithrix ferrooxidans]
MSMMDVDLNTWRLLAHADTHFSDVEIVTQTSPTTTHRYSFGDFTKRSKKLMNVLDGLGLTENAKVATLSWNNYRHLECYFAIPCTGRILHTLNARLSSEDLIFIINDAKDEAIFTTPDLVPVLEAIAEQIPTVKKIIVMDDVIPQSSIEGLESYEELLSNALDEYDEKPIPERQAAGLCYTSGTTGRPKGALYTHRSTYLHALNAASPSGMCFGISDCILPVVPMFHASAWGMVHAAIATGAKIAFAYPHLHPSSFVDLLINEEVTLAAGVPTVWIGLEEELRSRGELKLSLREIVCGGSQPPKALIARYRDNFNIPIVQAWGMTETSPLATVARPKHSMRHLGADELLERVGGQAGIPAPGIDVALRDDEWSQVDWDGTSMGNLYVRGPWVISAYLHERGADSFTEDGWFKTGDVAIGSPDGYFVIADRTKDLIKSGGEWISSVDLEGALMAMPGVVEAAVIAMPDDKWQERPLACVVLDKDATIDIESIKAHLETQGFAKWQLPDKVEFIDQVPRTSVGKFDKKTLRAKFTSQDEPGSYNKN